MSFSTNHYNYTKNSKVIDMALINIEQLGYVEVEEMQKIHENEINLINAIDALATECVAGEDKIDALVEKIETYIQHVREHFDYEEELMEEHDFFSADLHAMAHQMFLADLMYAAKHFRENGDLNKIVAFVRKSPEWLESHIETLDVPTAEFLAKKL